MEAIYQFLAQQAPAFALALVMLAVCWLVMKITVLCCRQKRARGALLEKQNGMAKKAEEQVAKMGQMVERQEDMTKKAEGQVEKMRQMVERQEDMTKKAEEQAAKMGKIVERQEKLNKRITLIRLTLEDMNRKLDRFLQTKNPNSPISRPPHLPPVQ